MNTISLKASWHVKAPLQEVFKIMTNFEKFPEYFPEVAKNLRVVKRDGNHIEIDASVKSFGQVFPVSMKTEILPGRGYISDNVSPKFGTSGHEEFLLSEDKAGTRIDYHYQVTIHKSWLRIVARPLIGWYSMKFWERAVIHELKRIVEE